MNANAALLIQLGAQLATKLLEVNMLLQPAAQEGRDVTDAEIDQSRVARDVAILKAGSAGH